MIGRFLRWLFPHNQLLKTVFAKPKPVMTMRIYRAATDSWEDGPPVNASVRRK